MPLYGEKTYTKKKLRCSVCNKLVEHTIEKKFVGTEAVPIYSYRTTCSNCGAKKYFPKEPEEDTYYRI